MRYFDSSMYEKKIGTMQFSYKVIRYLCFQMFEKEILRNYKRLISY